MKSFIFVAFIVFSVYSVNCSNANEKLTFQRICPNNTFIFEKQEINGFYMIEEKDVKIVTKYAERQFIYDIKAKLEQDYLIEDVHTKKVFFKNLNRLAMNNEKKLAFGVRKLDKYYNQQISKLNKFMAKTVKGNRNKMTYMADIDQTIYLPAYHKNYDMNDETNCFHLSNYDLPYFYKKPFLMPLSN